jgi:uncharacterized protein (TIGR00369 family)
MPAAPDDRSSGEFDPRAYEQRVGLPVLMGYRLTEWSAERAVVELVVGPQHLNRSGVLHGGVLATLLDSALGFAGCWCPHPGRYRSAVTLSLTTNYIGQVRSGLVRTIARKGPGGSRIYTCTGETLGEDGAIIAMAQGVFRYRSGSERSEGVPRPVPEQESR